MIINNWIANIMKFIADTLELLWNTTVYSIAINYLVSKQNLHTSIFGFKPDNYWYWDKNITYDTTCKNKILFLSCVQKFCLNTWLKFTCLNPEQLLLLLWIYISMNKFGVVMNPNPTIHRLKKKHLQILFQFKSSRSFI